ncbi:hypothetical protein FC093_23245 [Ilyomonas limi]|uniref:Uncharacterized protein n=1 Tax=Ilyomonas limi TaxID=2575867 RepID=A0A4U3KT06_9BACT|nr:hypothetical protein [Ilyomonas limi]TKK64127.1 hypothetical protein FC093_23245 [Ilyomonas limi]
MKKTSLCQFAISDNSQLSPLDFNVLLSKVMHTKGKGKNSNSNTLLLAMLSKGLAAGEYTPFINPPLIAPYLNEEAPAIQRYNLELQIKDQSKAFDKAAAKYNRLEKKGKTLGKKKMDIEGEIQKNQHQLQFRMIEVMAKRHQLADSFDQRDTNRRLLQTP